MSNYRAFVKEHIHKCPGATQPEKMKAVAALWRRQKEGRGEGLKPPGFAASGGGWFNQVPVTDSSFLPKRKAVERPLLPDIAAISRAAQVQRPPTPRDEVRLPPIRRPGPSSRAIGGNLKDPQMMAALNGAYASPKPNDTHPKRRRSTKVAPMGMVHRGRKSNQVVPMGNGLRMPGGGGLHAPGMARYSRGGVIDSALASILGDHLTKGGAIRRRKRRGGAAKEGLLASLLHGLNAKVQVN